MPNDRGGKELGLWLELQFVQAFFSIGTEQAWTAYWLWRFKSVGPQSR
jgi:hypothetical protein